MEKIFLKKYPKKSRMCVSFLRNRQNNLRNRGGFRDKAYTRWKSLTHDLKGGTI